MTGTVGLVLAGGRSSRFGTDKAVALLEGRPLLLWARDALAEVCDRVAVSARQGSAAEDLARTAGLEVLHDDPTHPNGPLAGVARGLGWAAGAERLAILPCDTPRVTGTVMARLIDALGAEHGVSAVETADGLHALCAVIRTDRAASLIAALDRGEHPPVREAWAAMGLRRVMFAEAAGFANVNRARDLGPLDMPHRSND